MKPSHYLWLLFVSGFSAQVASAADLQAFVKQYCIECHDNASHEGNLSFESLAIPPRASDLKPWHRALLQLERRNMPPASASQPTAEERRAVVLDLEQQLATLPPSASQHGTVLRRLSRTEYRNTIRDLLDLNVESFDPTREFPDDTRVHGFSSNGEKLVTSSFLLRGYLEAAEQIVERAIHFEPEPETRRWELLPPFDKTTRGFIRSEPDYFRKVLKQEPPYQTIYERMRDLPKMGYHPIDDLKEGVPVSGWYKIRIQAEAKFRHANLDPKKMRFPSLWDPTQPLRLLLCTGTLMGIDPENTEALEFAATHLQAGQRDLAIWDLPDDELTWLECRVWLDRGHFPRLGFPNGPSEANYRLQNYFLDNKETLLSKERLEDFEIDFKRAGHSNIPTWFESPRVRISKIEIEGPLNDSWPPRSHRIVFGNEPYRSENAEQVLQAFASRAWRRPVSVDQIQPLVKLVRGSEKRGLSGQAAIQEGLKALLCSPEFLYREEQNQQLNQYELASRLSYFLWGSMPDETLFELARLEKLHMPEVRREQALRMLADPRASTFTNEFIDGWLGLQKLGSMAPDVHKFSVYYNDALEPAMKDETRLFFQQTLNSNLPIRRFLDSDSMIVNRELAALYGIKPDVFRSHQGQPVPGLSPEDLVPDADGHAPTLAFAQVPVPDHRRGGLLGQGSILTLTANGVDTSPVIRGVWVLENLLGAPPNPPPPDIPAIEPDIRGATTIREQLQKHRASAACAACHSQIDPPGFALENFDAIGRWRGHYVNGKQALQIDASGEFGPIRFHDVSEFKAALLDREDQFARCLVEKLLFFALGRELTLSDRAQIRQILDAGEAGGYRFQDLVLLCVESDLFQCKN